MLLTRTLKLVVCGAAAVAIPAVLAGCQKETSNAPATAPSGGGVGPTTGLAVPTVSSTNTPSTGMPATRPSAATTRPYAGSGNGLGSGGPGGGGGTGGLPPLPRIAPGTMPSLPPMAPTTGPFTRPAFPPTQEFNK